MSLKTSFLDLKESFAALPRNAEKCGVLLTQLKVGILDCIPNPPVEKYFSETY
jgi:hypothetical protein